MSDRADLVSVAVPVAIDRGFTYQVPAGWARPSPGSRVLVPFGTRVLIGVVRPGSVEETPDKDRLRELLVDLDGGHPSLQPDLVRVCEWMSDYYLGPVGEVYRLALPGLMTNADARVATISEAGEAARESGGAWMGRGVALDDRTRRLLDALSEAGPRGLAVGKLARVRPRITGVLKLLAQCEQRGLCTVGWSEADPAMRVELHLRRTGYLRGSADEETLQRVVGRSKQRRAMLDYLESLLDDENPEAGWVSIGELRGPFPRARQLLAPLVEGDLVVVDERPRELDPFAVTEVESTHPQAPTPDQAAALETLRAAAEPGCYSSSVLHGITGSGKTEVYLQLIADLRQRDAGAIVLVPEIALTPQLADRFRARFGERVAVLHSGLTPRGRVDAWQQIRAGHRPIVIGARSAVFAPVPNLGAIVVDEEHDPSFKQEDGVRYHARDVALVRGRDAGAQVILGSATPSLETYVNAHRGKHRLLELHTRPTPRPLPKVEIVPLSVHRPDPDSMLTALMRQAVLDTVASGEQAILFLNRRGFTTSLICETCGSFQQCPDCSAPSLTYHLGRNRLVCHLCGHIEGTPEQCRKCGGRELTHGGVGTERVELALARQLPGARVLRLDRDTTRGRRLLDTLAKFRQGGADVLVGTQMLSKGHDFPGVTLVGVLAGDHGLAMPDPRAAERTFQLLTQVAGRAGRGDRPGRVLIQAYGIEHPAVVAASKHDYGGFAELELEARQRLGNPPSGYLVLIRISGLDGKAVEARAHATADRIRQGIEAITRHQKEAGDGQPVPDLLGPVPSPIHKINRRTRWQVLIRSRQRGPLRWLLGRLRPGLGALGHGAAQTLAIADVDPQNLL